MTTFSYDHPHFNVRRHFLSAKQGGAAATSYARFRMAGAGKLIAIHYVVVTAASAGATYALQVDGSTINTWTAETTAGNTVTRTINRTTTALTEVYTVLTGAQSSGTVDVIYEYVLTSDGTTTG